MAETPAMKVLFPKSIVEIPKNLTVVLKDKYWVTTPNDEIIVHKWFDSATKVQYLPQCSDNEKSIRNLCLTNNVSTYEKLSVVYLPFYMLRNYLEAVDALCD